MKYLIVFVLSLALCAASTLRVRNSKLGITNAKTASDGQFPYQVGLVMEFGPDKASWCGGSLIGNEWVLTAAHCTEGVVYVTVFLGATIRTTAEIKHSVSRNNIISHSGFDMHTMKNDIALIRIPHTKYTTRIQDVKLPAISNSYSTYVTEKVITAGWGRISDSKPGVTDNLRWARFEVIFNAACAKIHDAMITATNICVYTPGAVSTCKGDSGGALVLESSKLQIGLTSYVALEGCERGDPAVFTRITSYLDWIKDNAGISY